MLRCVVITKLGNAFSINTENREDIDTFLLDIEEKEGIKIYRIIIKETGEVIETQEGTKNKGE